MRARLMVSVDIPLTLLCSRSTRERGSASAARAINVLQGSSPGAAGGCTAAPPFDTAGCCRLT